MNKPLAIAVTCVLGAIGLTWGATKLLAKKDTAKKDDTLPPSGDGSPAPPAGNSNTPSGSSLPNDGVNCGSIKTNHDGDYDYVKCGGTWYTKSKASPTTPSVKGSIPNWKSLAGNMAATGILNTAYPNG